jgi:hypothetical protein
MLVPTLLTKRADMGWLDRRRWTDHKKRGRRVQRREGTIQNGIRRDGEVEEGRGEERREGVEEQGERQEEQGKVEQVWANDGQ